MSHEYGFTLKAPVFELLPRPSSSFTTTLSEKGVLLKCDLPHLQSQMADPPEIALHFLATDLNMQHDELLHQSPYPYNHTTMPIHTVTPRRRPLVFAARYTAWGDGQFPLSLGLLLDTGVGDVADHRYYRELRRTVAVACAQAVLGRTAKGDGAVVLGTANNFNRFGRLRALPLLEATSVGHLFELLS